MKRHSKNSCPSCRRLEAIVEALRAEVAPLREQLAAALKNSSTSSKPPSSDIVKPKPPPTDDSAKRSIGGQLGHTKHEREPFTAAQVTQFETHEHLKGTPDLRPDSISGYLTAVRAVRSIINVKKAKRYY
jgi:Family of unknown function (DUF6444)